MSTVTNAAVTCRRGLFGKDVKATTDPTTTFCKVEGHGTCIGSCSLDCDTAYWEVRVGDNPEGVCIGVKRFNPKQPSDLCIGLDEKGSDAETQSESYLFSGQNLKSGDVLGIYWDQTDLPMLSFAINGVEMPSSAILRIRPAIDIYPAVSVKKGSSCEMIFDGNHFLHPPKSSKFKMIVCATSLI
jgi:hypothetical protein